MWRHIERMPFLLDDKARNPFTFGAILSSSNAAAFALGNPPAGLVWFADIVPGETASGSIALWGFRAYGRQDLLKVIMEAVFQQYDLHRIYVLIPSPNLPSQRLATSLNFRQEGHIVEALRYNGAWTDVEIYSLLRRGTFYDRVV